MSDMNDLELAIRVRVEGQQAIDSTTNSTKALGTAAKTESGAVDLLMLEIKGLAAEMNQLNTHMAASPNHLNSLGGGAKKVASESTQARMAVRGMGEEIGVHMPRFVANFLTSLGPVGPALAKAFSVVAILGILEILPQLYQKIEEFGEKLGGLTERVRKQHKEMAEQNDRMGETALSNAEKLQALNEVGVEGSAKVGLQMRNMTASAKEYGKALGEAVKQLNEAKAKEAEFSKWSMSGDKKRAEEETDRQQAKVDKLVDETRKRATNGPEYQALAKDTAIKAADEKRAADLAGASATKTLALARIDAEEKTIKQMRELRLINDQQEMQQISDQADARVMQEKKTADQIYAIKAKQPGANKALLQTELNETKDTADQRAAAIKKELDLEQQIKAKALAENIARARHATEDEIAGLHIDTAKAVASRQSAFTQHMTSADVRPGREVDAVQKTYDESIRLSDVLQDKEQERIDKAQEWANNEIDSLKRIEAQGKVQLDREKLIAEVQARRDEARITAEEKIADLQKKRLEEARTESDKLYDAIHGGGAGVQKYFVAMANNFEKQLFTNLLTMGGPKNSGGSMGGVLDTLHNAMPGQRSADGSNTSIGDLLQGTIFGQRTPTSALKTSDKPLVDSTIKYAGADAVTSAVGPNSPEVISRKDNTTAITALTTSVALLTGVLQGKQPSLMNGAVQPIAAPAETATVAAAAGAATTAAVTATAATAAAATAAAATAAGVGATGQSPAAANAPGSGQVQTQTIGSSIGSALAMLTLGGTLAAAVGQKQSPGIRVVSGPGQGKSGVEAYPYGSSLWADTPLSEKIAVGGLAATAGFSALGKTNIFGQLQGSSSSVANAVGDFGSGVVKGPTQGLGTYNSKTGQISGGIIGGWSDPNVSWGQEAGQIAGLGVSVAGGVMSAIKGFSQGGGRGITSGIASVAGTAAMLDPEPISKGILTAVAAVGGIVKDLFGDPKAERQRDMTNTLAQNAFIAPPTVNGVQSINGNNMAFNKYGKMTATAFGGYNVTDATEYQNQMTGAYFKTPGSVSNGDYIGTPNITPDQVTPSYRQASGGGGGMINLTVHALDSQSIMDRSSDIGMAIYKELNAGGALGLRIQQTVLGA